MKRKTNMPLLSGNLAGKSAVKVSLEESARPLNATDFSEADLRKFWSRVDRRGPNECWNWTRGKIGSGYGVLSTSAYHRPLLVHRISYALYFGATIRLTLHKCDNPSCVNPAHLFDGTQAENTHDMMRKGRARFRDWRGEENPWNQLSEAQAGEILSMKGGRLSQTAIDKIYGVQQACISKIWLRRTWRHLSQHSK